MPRLNSGTVLAATVALVLALAGAYLARQFLLSKTENPVAAEKPAVKKDEPINVPVATTDLPPNRVIRRGDVGVLKLSKEDLAKRKLPPIWISNANDITNRVLKQGVKAGDVFSPDDMYPEGTGPTVADELEPGLRAVTITVNDTGLVSGFASPGTRVDVLFRLKAPAAADAKGRQPSTYTILENTRVLAVEQASFPGSKIDTGGTPAGGSKDKIKVTLAVTPEQASQLRLLEDNGDLSLALRRSDEKTLDELKQEAATAAERLAQLQQEASKLEEIIQDAAEIDAKFDDKGRAAELKKELSEQQQQVARLEQELQRTKARPPQQRLGEVLQTSPPLAKKLPLGMRAVTVAVKGSGFVDGFAVAGSMVDVLFRLSAGEGRKGQKETTFTVLEGVEVLALDQSVEPVPQTTSGTQAGGDHEVRVTLAVTADEAAKLKVIEGRGELSLALRSPDEKTPAVLAKELAQANERLAELRRDAKSLEEVIEAAKAMGSEFDDKGRAAELAQQIADQAAAISQLTQLQQLAVAAPEQKRLEEVLPLTKTPTIVEKLPPGMRAVTIPVKGTGLADGGAVPGSWVDVLFRLTQLAGRKDYKETTFTVVERAEVLAVDQASGSDDSPERDARVTLAVTLAQAAKLKVIEGRGDLSLLLRSPKETADQGKSLQPSAGAEVQAALKDAQLQLEELQVEREALRKMAEIAVRRGVPFARKARLDEVTGLAKSRQAEVEKLQAKLSEQQTAAQRDGAATGNYTLAGVLGIPEPPPKPAAVPERTMEIFLGSQRKTIFFDQADGTSREEDGPVGAKKTDANREPQGDDTSDVQSPAL